MAEPTLAGTRLIAFTLPGQAGAPAQGLQPLRADHGGVGEGRRVDLVVGFSMGAVVAYEMVVSAPSRPRGVTGDQPVRPGEPLLSSHHPVRVVPGTVP